MEEKHSNIFFCYSWKLCSFLRALGFQYKDINVNKASNHRYWTFEYSPQFREVLALYTELKHKFN